MEWHHCSNPCKQKREAQIHFPSETSVHTALRDLISLTRDPRKATSSWAGMRKRAQLANGCGDDVNTASKTDEFLRLAENSSQGPEFNSWFNTRHSRTLKSKHEFCDALKYRSSFHSNTTKKISAEVCRFLWSDTILNTQSQYEKQECSQAGKREQQWIIVIIISTCRRSVCSHMTPHFSSSPDMMEAKRGKARQGAAGGIVLHYCCAHVQ